MKKIFHRNRAILLNVFLGKKLLYIHTCMYTGMWIHAYSCLCSTPYKFQRSCVFFCLYRSVLSGCCFNLNTSINLCFLQCQLQFVNEIVSSPINIGLYICKYLLYYLPIFYSHILVPFALVSVFQSYPKLMYI